MSRLVLSVLLSLFVFLFSLSCFAQDSVNFKKLSKYQWHEVNSQNFSIISNEQPKTLEALAIELEQFRYFVSTYMGLKQLDGLPQVKFLVLKSGSSFKALNLDSNIAGIYSAQTSGFFSIASADELKLNKKKPSWGKHVIYHEMIHHFEGNQAEKLFTPLWYKEGTAEYLATMVKHTDSIMFGTVSALSFRFQSMVSNTGGRYRSVDLENLFKSKQYVPDSIKSDRQRRLEINRFYARSFITVHYLNSSSEKRKQLKTYLRLLNQGNSIDDAFKAAFNTSFEALSEQVNDYLTGKKLLARAFSTKGKGFAFPEFSPKVTALNLDDALYKAINIRLRFNSFAGKNYKVSQVIEDFDKHVSNDNYVALLRARFDNTQTPAEKKQAMQTLIDQKVHLSQAYYHYGQALSQQANTMRKTNNSNWLAVNKKSRSYFRKAVGAYSYNGDALRRLAQSYIYSPYDDKNAKEGAVCYEIMSVLHEVPDDIRNHALFSVALGNYQEALRLINRYIGLNDDNWSQGYAIWLRDSLLLTQLPVKKIKTITQTNITYQDGSQYEGDIVNGLPQGQGKYKDISGMQYTGQWAQHLPHGNGLVTATNAMTYQGAFIHGAVQGKGQLIYSRDKEKPHHYTGDFYRFMEHGYGAMQSPNFLHEGPWEKGLEHGPSTVTLNNNGEKKQINWVWGVPTITLNDGRSMITPNIDFTDFTPIEKAKGYCKKNEDAKYIPCELADSK